MEFGTAVVSREHNAKNRLQKAHLSGKTSIAIGYLRAKTALSCNWHLK